MKSFLLGISGNKNNNNNNNSPAKDIELQALKLKANLKVFFMGSPRGDSNLNRTQLIKEYVKTSFSLVPSLTTIGVDFQLKTVEDGNNVIKAQCWDIPGLERFRTIAAAYTRGTHAIVLAIDITKEDWQNKATQTVQHLRQSEMISKPIFFIGMTSNDKPAVATQDDFNSFIQEQSVLIGENLQIAQSQIINIDNKSQLDAAMDVVVITAARIAYSAEFDEVTQNTSTIGFGKK